DEKTKLSRLIGNGKISPDMDMPLFFKVLRGSGISTQKIENMLENGFSSYRNQPSYRQQTSILGKDDNQLKQELLRRGMLRVFSQIDPQYIQNSVADDMIRRSGQPSGSLNYLPSLRIEGGLGWRINRFRPRMPGDVVAIMLTYDENSEELKKYKDDPRFSIERDSPTRGGPSRYIVRVAEKDKYIPTDPERVKFDDGLSQLAKAY